MEKKMYEVIGLSKKDVLEIQEYVFLLFADNENKSMGEMLIKIDRYFGGMKNNYAMYLLGLKTAEAREAEKDKEIYQLKSTLSIYQKAIYGVIKNKITT